MLLNGAQRTAGIEDLKKHRSPAAEERAHQDFGLRAHVRGGQIDERARAAVSAEECAAQAHVLRRDVAMREQRRLGRASGSGGEDDQRAIVFLDRGSGRCQFGRAGIGRVRRGTRGGFCQRRIGAEALVRLGCAYCEEMLNPGAPGSHGAAHLAEIDGAVQAERDKTARAQHLDDANDFSRGQAQVKRNHNYADLEQTVFEQNVIHRHGQQRDNVIAFFEAEAQTLTGQGRGEAVKFSPSDGAAGFGAHEGRGFRPFPGPLRHHAMQQMAIGKLLVVIVKGKLG